MVLNGSLGRPRNQYGKPPSSFCMAVSSVIASSMAASISAALGSSGASKASSTSRSEAIASSCEARPSDDE